MRPGIAAATVLALGAACGRLDFTSRPDGSVSGDGTGGSGDATGDAAPLCAAGLMTCDGFDGAVIDTGVWSVYGDVTRDTTIMHRGAASLRARIPATTAGTEVASYIAHTGSNISTATVLWTRAWLRLGFLPEMTNALELIAIQQTGSQGEYVFARAANAEVYHQFDGRVAMANTALPVNTWFCIVWHVILDTSNGSSTVTSDVLPTLSIASSVTQGIPPVDAVAIGSYYAPSNLDVATPAFDLWIDDVIVDPQPVTCAD